MPEKSNTSNRQVSKPKAGWLPLPNAVFTLGVADEWDAAATSGTMEAVAMSLPELQAILKEESGAAQVEIDPAQCTFVFQFSNGSSTWGGPPWELIEQINGAKAAPDPRQDAEALFNKVGLVRASAEEAEKARLEFEAVRKATSLVWRQYMLREFDRAIAANEIALYARVGSAIAPFEALPPDVWRMLTILDWQNAIMRDPDGLLFYSLHGQRARLTVSTSRDESAAIRALATVLAHDPDLKRADAEGWCEKAGFKLPHRAFRFRVWPKARQRAGLPEFAAPGRKAKSVR